MPADSYLYTPVKISRATPGWEDGRIVSSRTSKRTPLFGVPDLVLFHPAHGIVFNGTRAIPSLPNLDKRHLRQVCAHVELMKAFWEC